MEQATEINRSDFDAVPLVDYTDLANNRLRFLRDLKYALCDVGFMVLLNAPGLEAAFQDRCFGAAHAYFDGPPEVKERSKMTLSPHFRGYSYHYTKERVNIAAEAYQFGREQPSETDSSIPIWHRMRRGPNLWPEGLPGFRETITELHGRYLPLSRELGHLICELLGVPVERYDRYFLEQDPEYVAAMNHTLAPSEYSEEERAAMTSSLVTVLGAGAHVDGAPFVSLLIADQPGLEVLKLDGRTWVDVPVIPGSVVVNIGATLQYLSGRRMVATMHRVNPLKPLSRRISLPYFLLPKLDEDLAPFDGRPPSRSRDRGVAYAMDRMQLFRECTERWYPEEFKQVQATFEEEHRAIRAARNDTAKSKL